MIHAAKETALSSFLDTIQASWTWERLTEAERGKFIDVIPNTIFGTFHQRLSVLDAIYRAFLAGLGYKPIGWREEAK